MNVSIKAFGLASAFIKSGINTVELPNGATVGQLISEIAATDKDKGWTMLEGATFLVNKENAGRDTILSDGDEVIIMVRMAGG